MQLARSRECSCFFLQPWPSLAAGTVSRRSTGWRRYAQIPRHLIRPTLVRRRQGKKRAAHGAAQRVNREASNRVDRSHSSPDDWTVKLRTVKLKEGLTAAPKSDISAACLAWNRLISGHREAQRLKKDAATSALARLARIVASIRSIS